MNLPTKTHLGEVWPFTGGALDADKLGPMYLEGEREPSVNAPMRLPVFDIGQRVIVKPTPGSPDPAIRKGGPGTVCHIKQVSTPGLPRTHTMVYVIVDDAQEAKAEPYDASELQIEPTV